MIPLTIIRWEYISRHGDERRGRKTKTVYFNVSHIYKLEEEEHGTRVFYARHGDALAEESPSQISSLMLRVHQIRNASANY